MLLRFGMASTRLYTHKCSTYEVYGVNGDVHRQRI